MADIILYNHNRELDVYADVLAMSGHSTNLIPDPFTEKGGLIVPKHDLAIVNGVVGTYYQGLLPGVDLGDMRGISIEVIKRLRGHSQFPILYFFRGIPPDYLDETLAERAEEAGATKSVDKSRLRRPTDIVDIVKQLILS